MNRMKKRTGSTESVIASDLSEPMPEPVDNTPEAGVFVEGISKVFAVGKAERSAIERVDFHIERGGVTAVVGPTGCGKTTLLNIVGGFESPSSGGVRVFGQLVTGPTSDCGYVFQDANLFPWLTVKENVMFGAKHGKVNRRDWADRTGLNRRADEYLELLGLSDARNLYPYQISGGMRARTALGRVFLLGPRLLLMDEPFAALDALTRAALHRLVLRQLALDRSRSILLITHDIEEALLLATRVHIMSSAPGRIIESIDVPFGWPRNYEDVIGDPELGILKRKVLEELMPYINL